MVIVRGQELRVDIKGELEQYDWFRAKWTGEKLIACSPFRTEKRPSFAVCLEVGKWVDSGGDGDWAKGHFVKLLAFLRNETWEEIEEYLLGLYSPNYAEVDSLKLKLNFQYEKEKPQFLTLEDLNPYAYKHPYLTRRGIPEKVQRAVKIGYEREHQAVVIPWFDRKGRLVTMKFRSVNDKRFWYYAKGQRIKNHLYGLDLVHRLGRTTVFITEGEIDALTLWKSGRAALAMGGAFLTEIQRDLILQSPITALVIASDNDKAGQRVKASIVEQLSGFIGLEEITFPPNRKDVNEFTQEELERLTSKPIGLNLIQ